MPKVRSLAWTRVAPGYYTAPGGFEIVRYYGHEMGRHVPDSHVEWRVSRDDEWWSSWGTLREAKDAAEWDD